MLLFRKQMTDYLNLPMGDKAPELVNAVVEVPLRGVNKYEYDKELQVFRLDRALYSPVHYPGDYGFIPSTLAGDGDALDVLVLVDSPSFSGCVIEVKPIGILQMVDQKAEDEKILAVARKDPRYGELKEYTEINSHLLREIEHFFSIYKELEGKQTQMHGWKDANAARKIITEARERFGSRKAA